MNTISGFDNLPVLGKLPPAEAANKLCEVGEAVAAEVLESARQDIPQTYSAWSLLGDKPWQHTAHTLGYLAPAPPNSRDLPIQPASNITHDLTLKSDHN